MTGPTDELCLLKCKDKLDSVQFGDLEKVFKVAQGARSIQVLERMIQELVFAADARQKKFFITLIDLHTMRLPGQDPGLAMRPASCPQGKAGWMNQSYHTQLEIVHPSSAQGVFYIRI